MHDETRDGLTPVFLGRIPILDRDKAAFGYEFFSPDDASGGARGTHFAADVVCRMFAELGLANALGTHRAFVRVDETLFTQGTIELIKEKNIVLELDATRPMSDDLLAAYRGLRDRGYEFCVAAGGQRNAAVNRLLPLAHFVKIDAGALAPAAVRDLVGVFKNPAYHLIATGIDSEQSFSLSRSAGCSYFQGYFFAHPVIVKGHKLDTTVQTLFRLLELIDRNADITEIEDLLKSDPALAVNLLRLANTMAASPGARVSSIRHAISLLGRKQLQRWLQLLVFTNSNTAASVQRNPLMQLAAMRARFMEVLAERCYPGRKDLREPAFLTGLLSLMPAGLGMSLVDILANVSVAPEVRRALSRHEGELGLLLELTEHYDNNDRAATDASLSKLGGRANLHALGECLGEVIAWIRPLDGDSGLA